MLNTVEFGLIRIVEAGAVDRRFDVLVGYDLVCEWAFWQLADGERRRRGRRGRGHRLRPQNFLKSLDRIKNSCYNITIVKENRKEKNNAVM